MKSLFLAVLVAMTLFAATSVAQSGPFSVTQSGEVVTAIAGDISCVFTGPFPSDDLLITCFVGKTMKFSQLFRPAPGTCNDNGPSNKSIPDEFGPTGDGNFISWNICQSMTGRVFSWSVDADDKAMGSGTFHL